MSSFFVAPRPVQSQRPISHRFVVAVTTAPMFAMAFLQFVLPVLAADMMRSVDQRPEAYGMVAGAMGAGSVALFLTNSALLPCLGPLRTLRLAITFALLGIAATLVGTLSAMIVGAMLMGFGYAAVTPAGSQLLADFVPRELWATAFSVRQTSVPVGGILAGLVGTLLVIEGGWRAALGMAAGLTGLMGVMLLLVPRELNTKRALQPFSMKRLISPAVLLRPFQQVFGSGVIALLVTGGIGLSMVHGVVTIFLISYLTTVHDVSMFHAGMLFAAVQAAGIVGRFGLGPIADRLGSPLPVLIVVTPMSFAATLLLGMFSPAWPKWFQFFVAGWVGLSTGTWNGLFLAEVARRVPAAEVGVTTATIGVFNFATYAAAPVAFGLLAGVIGWPFAFLAAGVGALIALAAFAPLETM